MSIPFPEAERVRYNSNPIVELTCGLRFPRILKINENNPVEFQERIREQYPVYRSIVGHQNEFKINIPSSPNNVQRAPIFTQSVTKNHQFYSADHNFRVNLSCASLSVSTREYKSWEDFSPRMRVPIEALIDIYKPIFYERISLRYVDAIRKSKCNIKKNVSWGKLIQPCAAGYFANSQIAPSVKNYSSTVEIDIGEGATAQIQTCLADVNDTEKGKPIGQTEIAFMIISDLFFLRKDLDEAYRAIDYLHTVAYRLLRSIIKDKLHEAMGPREV